MNSKKWLKIFVVLSFLGVGFVGGVNWVVDPYGSNNLIQKDWNKIKLGNIKRPLSFKLPIIKNGEIDVLTLGTSRTGVMDIDIIKNYYSGNIFSLSSPSSLAEEQYFILRYALKHNNIKTLIYGIDFMSFNGNKEKPSSDFNEHRKSIENFENIDNPVINYFSIDTLKYSLKMILNKKDTFYTYQGERVYINAIESIRNGTFKFKYDIEKFKTNAQYSPYKFSSKQLDYFKKSIELCQANNINIILYTPPMYYKHFFNIYTNLENDFVIFKKELVRVKSYYDFSGINEISKNESNYVDESHLRGELAKNIMSKIFNDNSIKTPKDYGILVTKENIDEHLENLKTQIKNYDLEKTLK